MYDQSQLMRGTLEGCILRILQGRLSYGYEIVTRLQQVGFAELREGTIYPLLLRLEKKGMISARYQSSPLGPERKYYTLTQEGEVLLAEFRQSWQQVSATVNTVLEQGEATYEDKL